MPRILPELIFLRHGETEWNQSGRHQGRFDTPLTEKGRAQARRQGELVREIAGFRFFDVWISPQSRARATAGIALSGMGNDICTDERLCEVDFGEWQGLTTEEIRQRNPGLVERDPFLWQFQSPGGERFADVVERCESFLNDIRDPSIIVTHGLVSIVMRGLVLGLDADGMREVGGGQGVVYQLLDGRQTRFV